MRSTFQHAKSVLLEHGEIIHEQVRDVWCDPTLVVIGEAHFHPAVQQDVFRMLCELHDNTPIDVFAIEGSEYYLQQAKEVLLNPGALLHDISEMHRMLHEHGVDAKNAFASIFGDDFLTVSADDPGLYARGGAIDQECYELFSKYGMENAAFQKKLAEMLEITLRQRSVVMAQKATLALLHSKRQLGVLVVGAAHTPMIPEYTPYSVLETIESLPINALIALPKTMKALWLDIDRHPFDFWTSIDDTDANPYT